MHAHAPIDVFDVFAHCAFADIEVCCDLFIRKARFGEKASNFLLPSGQFGRH